MEFLFAIAIAIAVFLLVRSGLTRGRNFVRAFIFLDSLEAGASVDEANNFARMAFTNRKFRDLDERAIKRANLARVGRYGGRQLPIIKEAKERGYQER
jgi:hypothetical protein